MSYCAVMGELVMQRANGTTRRTVMSRPDPPESDTLVETRTSGGRTEFHFVGYEDGVPVYREVTA